AGATELAVSEVCLQGFTIGPHAGVQFHPEATEAIVADWLAPTNPPPPRGGTAPFFPAAGPAREQESAHRGALCPAWAARVSAHPAAGHLRAWIRVALRARRRVGAIDAGGRGGFPPGSGRYARHLCATSMMTWEAPGTFTMKTRKGSL